MKKLFTSIDKLIADIPDDKIAWIKALNDLESDKQENIANVVNAGKSTYGFVKNAYHDARDMMLALSTMATVPVYVHVNVDKKTGNESLYFYSLYKEDIARLFSDADEMDEEDVPKLGVDVYLSREDAEAALQTADFTDKELKETIICRIPFCILTDDNIGLFEDDDQLCIFFNYDDEASFYTRDELLPLVYSAMMSLRTLFLPDVTANIFSYIAENTLMEGLGTDDEDDDEEDDEPFPPSLRVLNNLPPC